MSGGNALLGVLLAVAAAWTFGGRRFARSARRRRYERGVVVGRSSRAAKDDDSLRFGDVWLPACSATQHFLFVGTTGSGKSLLQRRLMREPLRAISPGSDKRALIFDAKGDVASYLRQVGIEAPIYSLNPFHAPDGSVIPVAWDVAKDVTSPARAFNLAASLVPAEKGGANRYFTDAARQVVTAVIESMIKHAGSAWTFSDVVVAALNQRRIEQLLARDDDGRDTLAGFFGDDRTAYQVFTTIASKMAGYRAVAALWQRCDKRLSLRNWLRSDSVLLLGSQATTKASLDALNEQVFRIAVEEIDVQTNSATRRTWVWVDEARLSGSLLQSDLLPFLAVKGRSRGAALVLAFQDIEGFREAAGERVANEIIAQCSHKALLRLASEESSAWASRVVGQHETLEAFVSEGARGLSRQLSEQRVQKDAVLASQFYSIPVTNRQNGLAGYFVSPGLGAWRGQVSGNELQKVFVSEHDEIELAIPCRPESDQWLRPWTAEDRRRLALEVGIDASEDRELGATHDRTRRFSRACDMPAIREPANDI